MKINSFGNNQVQKVPFYKSIYIIDNQMALLCHRSTDDFDTAPNRPVSISAVLHYDDCSDLFKQLFVKFDRAVSFN